MSPHRPPIVSYVHRGERDVVRLSGADLARKPPSPAPHHLFERYATAATVSM